MSWGKRADMTVHGDEPFNAEPSRAALADSAVTPAEAFYVRNHGAVPEIDPASWRLWETEVEIGTGPLDILARAWDSAAATQPEDPAHLWNPKGYVNNAWAKVSVTGS